MLLPKFQPEGEEEIKRTAGSLEIVEYLRRDFMQLEEILKRTADLKPREK
jgi:hypothetical protein